MDKQELVSRMQEGQAWVPGKRVKLDFGSEGVILLDGAATRSPRKTVTPTQRSRSLGTIGRRWPPASWTA